MTRIGLIVFPGTNCERETAMAVLRAGMTPVEVLWNEPFTALHDLDGYILVGGFSYEDRSRAGVIAAHQPIMKAIMSQSALGKPVLGICNGAQILVEAGMIPGCERWHGQLALAENQRMQNNLLLGTGFYNAWVHMKPCTRPRPNAFTRHIASHERIHLPVAHAQGRFIMPKALLSHLEQHGMNVFQYCNAQGEVDAHFPVNPNGSMGNLAAILNEAGNVMAMMPHPERTPFGDAIFTSMRDYIENGETLLPKPYAVEPVRKDALPTYMPTPQASTFLTRLLITDNQAMTVQKTLQQLGLPVHVARYDHWEIAGLSAEEEVRLFKSGEIYCERKERPVPLQSLPKEYAAYVMVEAKDDSLGRKAKQQLEHRHGMRALTQCTHRTVWQFSSESADIATLMPDCLATHLIGNPYAHECYTFKPSIS